MNMHGRHFSAYRISLHESRTAYLYVCTRDTTSQVGLAEAAPKDSTSVIGISLQTVLDCRQVTLFSAAMAESLFTASMMRRSFSAKSSCRQLYQ